MFFDTCQMIPYKEDIIYNIFPKKEIKLMSKKCKRKMVGKRKSFEYKYGLNKHGLKVAKNE